MIDIVSNIIKPNDFYTSQYKSVYETILSIHNANMNVDIVTVSSELARNGLLKNENVNVLLNNIVANTATSFEAENYAKEIRACSVNRQLIELGNQISKLGYENDLNFTKSIGTAENLLYNLNQTSVTSSYQNIKQILLDINPTEIQDENSVSTGLREIDKYLGGLKKSNLIIIGGRTSMGKTSFALNIATNVAKQNYRVAMFSLEMSKSELMVRMLSSETGINQNKISRRRLNDYEFDSINLAMGVIGQYDFEIEDRSDITINEIRTIARHMNAVKPLDLIVVDYLQFIKSANTSKYENRVLELGEISRTLKTIAKELKVPVIALAQLNRSSVEPNSKVRYPQLTDIRECGNIEQDADSVIFVHRDAMLYRDEKEWLKAHPNETYPENEADIIIAKNRNGANAHIKLNFEPRTTTFTDREEY